MLGAGIDEHLVALVAGLQRRLEGGPHGVDALVVLGVLDQQRRLDRGHRRGLGRGAVERHACGEVGAHGGRQEVGGPAAPAEAGGAELAGGERVGLQESRAVQHVGAQLGGIEAGLQRAAVVVVAGIAADREQAVGREGEEAVECCAPRHVLDVGVEAAVLVNHQHRGERARARGLHQIAAHGARGAARRRPGDVARLDLGIGEGNRLRVGVARKQRLRHGEPAHGDGGGAREERAAVHAAVAILVVELEHAAVDVGLGEGGR